MLVNPVTLSPGRASDATKRCRWRVAPQAVVTAPAQHAAQTLESLGMPLVSIEAFDSSGIEPQRLLSLIESGWTSDQIMRLVMQQAA